ncbi:hypothetical protein V9L05_15150 [Bernardetia sp. Wsw4-3y2]|uniref:hypothetical protein n=1 Tax=Bernardetia sp. Wsw4-3y2 TaxID=3127471 RepID=UPI0030CF4952
MRLSIQDTTKRNELRARFSTYAADWEYKDQIIKGEFVPVLELYLNEVKLLVSFCDHAILLDTKAEQRNEIEIVRSLLLAKQQNYERASLEQRLETKEMLLNKEEDLHTLLHIIERSFTSIQKTGRNKGQLSFL